MSWIRLVALTCAAFIPFVVGAQSSAPLTFAEAVQKTLAAHPQFERLSLRLRAEQARAEAASLRPPLELNAEIENLGAHDEVRAFDGAEFTLSLTSLVERGGKRAARVDAAQRGIELLTLEQRIEMLDLLAETGRRFIAVASAQTTLTQLEERATQARRAVQLIEPRVSAGRSPRTEYVNSEIELKSAGLAVENARRQLEASQFTLAAQWAAPQERPVVVVDVYSLPDPRDFESLAGELEQLPDLERFAAEERVHDAELRLARAQAVADWRWTVGVRRLEEINEQALVLGFSMPLGARQRNASVVREAELRQAQVPLDAKASRLQLLPLIHAQWQQLRSARQTAQVIANEQLPLAREALTLTERGYDIGRFPYRELAIAQQQVLALEAQRLEAAVQYHLTRIEIERLTGAQLTLLKGQTP